MTLTEKTIVARWRKAVVAQAETLDEQNDKGGHDWHSLWAGFVCALGRPDLADWASYRRLGFPAEMDRP